MEYAPVSLTPNIWTLDHDLKLLGMNFGTRTTILRLSDGSLLLSAPGSMTPAQQMAIEQLGPVSILMAPNLFHHMFLKAAKDRWPSAKIVAPPGLKEKTGIL